MYNNGSGIMEIYVNKNKIISIKKIQEIINHMQWVIDMFNDELKQAHFYNEYQWQNKVNKMKEKGYSKKRIKYVKEHRENRINCKVLNSWKGELDNAVNMFVQQPMVQLVNNNVFTMIDFTKNNYRVIPSPVDYDEV